MKYCVDFRRTGEYIKTADEIIIPFAIANQDFVDILMGRDELINGHRLIIHINEEEEFIQHDFIKMFVPLQDKQIHFALRFNDYQQEHQTFYQQLKEHKINFFFTTNVDTWDIFYGLADIGVSDIYITNDLGFELNKLGPIAHAKNISLRAFPNVCQTSWRHGDTIKSFFIRPEDVSIYAEYIDVLEFYGPREQQEIYYKIYAKDKKWFGNLQEIIIGLSNELDSRFIMPLFGGVRTSCCKRCLKDNSCSICDLITQDLATTLKNNNQYFKY